MFYPEEIIFAPASSCNLHCSHCFSGRDYCRETFTAEEACAFLDSCLAAGRGDLLVGFSGGEPFLRADFLCTVSAFAAGKGFLFSRVMTNGMFGASPEERRKMLSRLFDAGFDGKVALSFDRFHGQSPEEAAEFLFAVLDCAGDSSAAEIWSVIPADGEDRAFFRAFRQMAEILGAGAPSWRAFRKPGRFLLRGNGFFIPVYRSRQSFSAADMRWNARRWFREDFCRGPGNCFFVHPDGMVAPCCGFSNRQPELLLGPAGAGYTELMRRAGCSPAVEACFVRGLASLRKELEAQGFSFPGKTEDPCAFCGYTAAGCNR